MINRVINYINHLRIKRKSWNSIGSFSIGIRSSIISPDCISLGDNFYAEDNLKLQAWKKYRDITYTPQIIIGGGVSFMSNCQVSCCNSITIGDGCLFGDNVFITDNFHGKSTLDEMDTPPLLRDLYSKGRVSIGKNVWVGRNVCIMPGVYIGDGAIIGANAVVTHDVPAFGVAVGIPATVIRLNNSRSL